MLSEDYKMVPGSYDEAKDLAYSSGKLFDKQNNKDNN